MVIYLGSTRSAKVGGAREAIKAIAEVDERFRAADVRTRDLGDAGPRMPMTEAAIIDGARRRAAALLATAAAADTDEAIFAVGLEGGLDPLPMDGRASCLALKTWACVTDGRQWSYGAGGAVILPEAIAQAVRAGRELGDVIDALAGAGVRSTRGAWGVFTRDLIDRREAFRLAVISAFAPFYNVEIYSHAAAAGPRSKS